MFRSGNERFSAGGERIESMHLKFSHTHTHTASYQRLLNRTYQYVEMIACHNYSPPKMDAITLRKSKRYVEAQPMFPVALSWSSRPSKQKKLHVQSNFCLLTVGCYSKLVETCNTRVQQSGCGLTVCAMPGIRAEKPQKSMNENVRHFWRQFRGCSSPVLGHMLPRTRKGRCLVAEQSFGMYII